MIADFPDLAAGTDAGAIYQVAAEPAGARCPGLLRGLPPIRLSSSPRVMPARRNEIEREFFRLGRTAVVDLVQTCYDQPGEPFCIGVNHLSGGPEPVPDDRWRVSPDEPSGDSR